MTERPILFNDDMVRAILDGRKTQTRRAIKPQPVEVPYAFQFKSGTYPIPEEQFRRYLANNHSPYGRPGDRLWVREAHAFVPRTAYARSDGVQQTINPHCLGQDTAAIYRQGWDRSTGGFRWRPSIHMPRWASRITLEIVSVRVERLQEISEVDARREGLFAERYDWQVSEFYLEDMAYRSTPDAGVRYSDPRHAFEELWVSINGPGSWDANPWVWVVEFRVIEPGEVAA